MQEQNSGLNSYDFFKRSLRNFFVRRPHHRLIPYQTPNNANSITSNQ